MSKTSSPKTITIESGEISRRNGIARSLSNACFRPRIVRNKKKYSRKSKGNSYG